MNCLKGGKIEANPKKEGRGPREKTQWIHARVDIILSNQIDGYANERGINRSRATRELVQKGLAVMSNKC